MTYLSFDPGGTTGYAIFNNDGQIKVWGDLHGLKELNSFLRGQERPNAVIIEEYRVRGDSRGLKANVGSKQETVQAIGVIKAQCFTWEIEPVEQPAAMKKIGEIWSKHKPYGAHKNSHRVDAYNHGVYFLVKNGIRSITGIEKDIEGGPA
jgi:hypothetical protein